MIESFLELVLGNVIEVAVVLLAGLLLGILISLLYWRGQVNEREDQIMELKTSVEETDSNMKDMRVRAQDLLNQRKKEIERLNTKLKDYEIVLENRENAIDTLNTQLKDYEILLTEREKRVELLDTQLGQREENIQDLAQRINEKDESINHLKTEAADLEKNIKESFNRVEDAETKVEELKQEITSLQARMHAMQDDFTHIMGIGPKVSSVLRFAGINTFAKLASTDINRITEILEDENPNLLRLTDPSTWLDQARLASEGLWEALADLQDSLKESRRMHSSKVDEVNIHPVSVELEVI